MSFTPAQSSPKSLGHVGWRKARQKYLLINSMEAAATENILKRMEFAMEARPLDSRERIPIEGKFGQGKNGYRFNYIRAKLQKTF